MTAGWTAVLDIGKTRSKASLWDENGVLMARRERTNPSVTAAGRLVLDAFGIELWLKAVLFEFAQMGPIDAIVPIAHGAGVALIHDDRLLTAPLDYEWPGPSTAREDYDRQRDPFAATGSPRLPGGLNLGAQLHWFETRGSADVRGGEIVPWAQYWAWVLCGEIAAEVTSLGCHSDLWRPHDRSPSELAVRRGWAERLARLTPAASVLGAPRPDWISETGLSARANVLCGIHDSNAALLAARSHAEVSGRDVTVLSTGTWFVAMRTPLLAGEVGAPLPEDRDCLLNVDLDGNPVPSSRFMGGREIELLAGIDAGDANADGIRVADAVKAVEGLQMFVPPQVPGVGPFPTPRSANPPGAHPKGDATALAHLYAALLADVSLDLIGSSDTLLIEGRFASAPAFTQALAALRPTMRVLVGSDRDGVTRGALDLANVPQTQAVILRREMPLPVDMTAYRARWREVAERGH
jgi:sugar (pentulose or hexulose) kinase